MINDIRENYKHVKRDFVKNKLSLFNDYQKQIRKKKNEKFNCAKREKHMKNS